MSCHKYMTIGDKDYIDCITTSTKEEFQEALDVLKELTESLPSKNDIFPEDLVD